MSGAQVLPVGNGDLLEQVKTGVRTSGAAHGLPAYAELLGPAPAAALIKAS